MELKEKKVKTEYKVLDRAYGNTQDYDIIECPGCKARVIRYDMNTFYCLCGECVIRTIRRKYE